ncbi:1-acyl-sn-glycerol-3-phosphate acyltransferase 4 [Trifolium repens]|nr:1-acyl-sn-glycerol-3-phosphate acyltransferase 4 [Trifolium repens]
MAVLTPVTSKFGAKYRSLAPFRFQRANHRTEVDWMYLWYLALQKGCIGYIKYILKSSLMRLPIFGWAIHILEFIPVERKWEADESNMRRMLSTFKDPQDPLWLTIFPEGTDFT